MNHSHFHNIVIRFIAICTTCAFLGLAIMAFVANNHGPVRWVIIFVALGGSIIYLYFLPRQDSDSFLAERRSNIGAGLELAGEGLRLLATYLEDDQNRRPKFRDLISKVVEYDPAAEREWEINLVLLADLFEWPQWSVQCLPSLCFRLDIPSKMNTLLVWRPIADVIPENHKFEVRERLCQGELLMVDAGDDTLNLIQRFASRVDLDRSRNPFPSARSAHGVVAQALLEIQLEDADMAQAAEMGREAILDQEGIGFSRAPSG